MDVSAGEFLRCELTANGPGQAVFSFACQHRPLWDAPDFSGHPKSHYAWKHLSQPGDADAAADTLALVLAFVGGITSYTFLMEKVDSAGRVLQTLKDFDAATTVATDVLRVGITVVVG